MPIQGEAGGVSAAARRRKKREDARRAREARATARKQRTSRPGHHDPKSGGTRPTYRQTVKSRKKSPRPKPVGRNFRPNQMGFAPTEGAGLLKNFGREAIDITQGAPSAFYTLGSAIYGDVKDPDAWRNPEDSRLQKDVIDPQIDYYRERYVEPFQEDGVAGGLKRIGKDFYDRPLTGALDVWAGASVAARGASIAKTGKLKNRPEPRKVRYKGATVSVPTSPNKLTEHFQRLADAYSVSHPDAAGIGAKSRVPRQGARNLRAEQDLRRARFHSDLQRLKNPDVFHRVRNRDLRVALYWEAQLPPDARGGSGLRAVLADMEKTRQGATGRTAKKLTKAERKLRRAIAQIDRSPDLQAQLASAKTLADDAENIYIRAGILTPEIAAQRKALMAERLGFEGASDTFVTHKSVPGRRSDVRQGRTRVGGGKTQVPSNLKHRNELKLYEQGRLRQDPQVIVEHWLRAQTFDFHNKVKDFLASMSDPIGPNGPNPGWFLINRQGKTTPRWWKDAIEDENPQRFYGAVRDYVSTYIKKEEGPEDPWIASGEVTQIDPVVVRQFFDRFVGPQGTESGLRRVVEATDILNGLVKTSLIYANPGYIPANLAGNMLFGVVHQGPFLPVNLYRSGKALTRDRELYNMIRAEAGMGPTQAIARTGDGPSRTMNAALNAEKKFAHFIGGIPDNWPRVAAWYYEARKRGHKTREQQMKLLLDESPEGQAERTQIRALENDAMVDFERLGPVERGWLSRVLFVWPWIRGAARWAYTTPRDRPVRSALLANESARQAQANEEETGPLPAYQEGVIPTGENEGIPTQRFTPLGVAAGILNTIEGREVPGEYLNPLLDAVYRTLNREVEYSSGPFRVDSMSEAAAENLGGLIPNIDFTKRMISPRESELYPDDDTRLGYLARRVGVGIPVGIDFDEANERARQETGASKPAEDRTKPLLDQLKKKAKSHNLLKSRDYRLAQAAVKRLGELEYLLDTADIPTGDYKMRLRIAADYGEESMPSYAQRFNRIERAGQKPEVTQQAYYEIRDLLFNDWLEAWDLDR